MNSYVTLTNFTTSTSFLGQTSILPYPCRLCRSHTESLDLAMDFFLSQWASRLPMYHQVCCLLQGVSPLSAARWPVWRTTQNPFSTLSIFILLQMELRGLAPSLHLCPLTFLNHVVHCLPREHHMDGKFPVKKTFGKCERWPCESLKCTRAQRGSLF